MMKIVVLDGYTVNPGDLSWSRLEAMGDFQCHARSNPEEVLSRARDADIVLLNKAQLPKSTIDQLPLLKYIGVIATGYNSVDISAARERGIPVCNVPAYGSASVAQHAFALLLELTNRVGTYAQSTAKGEWASAKDWTYSVGPLIELAGKTMGIVGLGDIGQQTAKIASALGMKVVGNRRNLGEKLERVEMLSLEELFKVSDVVSLHCPLTKDNEKFVNHTRLSSMKPSALLINTARGGLIDEDALAEVLNKGMIAGAGLDVLSSEPPRSDNPLLSAKNCLISPHVAWASREARARLLAMVADNVEAFLEGRPKNVVNK